MFDSFVALRKLSLFRESVRNLLIEFEVNQ